MQFGYFGLGSTEWAREMVILESAARLDVSDRDNAHWRELAYLGTEPVPATSTAVAPDKVEESIKLDPMESASQRKNWWWRAVFGNGIGGGFGVGHRGFMMR